MKDEPKKFARNDVGNKWAWCVWVNEEVVELEEYECDEEV